MLTGKKGWYKRVQKNTTAVTRGAEFSDGIAIGDGIDKMESTLKKATIKNIKTSAVAAPPGALTIPGNVACVKVVNVVFFCSNSCFN